MPAATWDFNQGRFDSQLGALPVTPRLRYQNYRFDAIVGEIDVQVGRKFSTHHLIIKE